MAVPTLTANSPSAGYIAWTSFNIQYNGAAYSVPASNTNATYTAWLYNGGSPLLVTNNNAPILSGTTDGTSTDWSGSTPILGPDDLLLFVNRNGVPINVQAAQLVDGDLIVPGTITSGNIATGTIVSNNLYSGGVQANLIQAANIATDTITANQIAAGAIGTSELSAGSVVADKIAAGAITTEKLTIGSVSDNLVLNSTFEDANAAGTGPANWSQAQTTGSPTFLWAAKIDGSKSIGVGPNSSANGGAWQSTPFPVAPGRTLAVSGLLQATAATGGAAYVRLYYGTTNTMTWSTGLIAGTPATPTKVTVTDLTASTVVTPAQGTAAGTATLIGNWTPTSTNVWLFQGQSVVPAGATWAILSLYNWSNATGGASIYYDDVSVNSVLVTAQLGDGVVTANQIAAGTITTTQIAANTITSGDIASGAITTTQLAANAVTASVIAAGAIDGKTITGATIRTSSSTPRVELNSTDIDRINLWSGITGEVTPAFVNAAKEPTSSAAYLLLESPTVSGWTVPQIQLMGAAPNNTTFVPGIYMDSVGVSASQMRPVQSEVATQESTTSTTYTNLTTVQSVTRVVPPSGQLLISLAAQISNNTAGDQGFMSCQVVDNTAGNTTVYTPSDNEATWVQSPSAGQNWRVGTTFMVTGLTPYNQVTVTAKFRANAGTASFTRRIMIVEPTF